MHYVANFPPPLRYYYSSPLSCITENEKEDIALLEEIEEFALEDMAKLLASLDPNHALLVAISSVKALGILNQWDSEEDDDES